MGDFVSLSKLIEKKSKKEHFKTSFSEEISRLNLAHEIKALRQQKKLTQKQVAEKADMPQSVIARIESGTHSVSITTLSKIARVFNKEVGLVESAQHRR
ncbi:hypothetical protein A2333_02885 [Candidatus Wolfebacteria bacterium RIFOXYB2_FULL_49_7]|uniref:HTH cro/C1-type domain-containing protein n=2 Tax=Candidatus Wolfeibacteriota TaxID=1752735 RepID=A0A1F8DZI8_9BACT|nr:MAG: hypothetical protein A2372_03140 [Candidatus Wolfebacteria bacterium RIFOXYB1_FULL_54_12]OGM95239.1 MAG: hypothetical protein A2524_03845 [Candidatus Wolfebacteria bacterium RIFOXYD12_FULL_48_21]OGM95355.1 MAG: hypothetical protein A2610_02595 [Candidatus Wolfebacteria bacterium RIFOXYD1_FULL_48_65]OGM95767.1 MAG: hypothetical protein A2532_03355 [Candidatus Wolfebacteria bacterium RIFOXYD2_FULL_48_11]OGM96723.1 MAG: hypothetical protein A2333_02885 [Candidatus Wolfebacteria bacterium R